nr:hypothetical protein [Thioalkalivibrio sp. AKL19]
MRSHGSLHKHIRALEAAGYVQAIRGRHQGGRLTDGLFRSPSREDEGAATGSWGTHTLPLLRRIAANQPIEALANPEPVEVPPALRGHGE